jgi:hypothetical protein
VATVDAQNDPGGARFTMRLPKKLTGIGTTCGFNIEIV